MMKFFSHYLGKKEINSMKYFQIVIKHTCSTRSTCWIALGSVLQINTSIIVLNWWFWQKLRMSSEFSYSHPNKISHSWTLGKLFVYFLFHFFFFFFSHNPDNFLNENVMTFPIIKVIKVIDVILTICFALMHAFVYTSPPSIHRTLRVEEAWYKVEP